MSAQRRTRSRSYGGQEAVTDLPKLLGQDLQAYYALPADLPHQLLTLLMQLGDRAKLNNWRLHMTIEMPVITGVWPQKQRAASNELSCWRIDYRFCGVTAQIRLYAQNEPEARAKAVNELRVRGLKVARGT
jgi:hypothetical protein